MSARRLGLGVLVVLGWSSAGLAEMSDQMEAQGNYVVPVPNRPDLLPFAKFSINRYTVRKINGTRVLRWQLPHDLSGERTIEIELRERNADRPDGDPVELVGPHASVRCVGDDWDSLQCETMRFVGLGINGGDVDRYLNRKYAGLPRAAKARDVARIFRNDPIGILTTQATDADCPDCSTGNGTWSVRYQNPTGQWISADMTLDRDHGVYTPGGVSGELFDLRYDGSDLEGHWQLGQARGWLRFDFVDADRFEGAWGFEGDGSPRGLWNGRRRE